MCKNCILFRKDSEEKNASMPPSPSPAVKLRKAVKEVRIWDNTLLNYMENKNVVCTVNNPLTLKENVLNWGIFIFLLNYCVPCLLLSLHGKFFCWIVLEKKISIQMKKELKLMPPPCRFWD